MQNVSTIASAVFIAIALLTLFQLYNASGRSKMVLIIIATWMLIQLILGSTGFYSNEFTLPPRFMLMPLPPLIGMIYLFCSIKGRSFIDKLNLKKLTLLHTIRIAVEAVLYYLFTAKAIPEIMTFAGRNFDIIAGITAPVIFYTAFYKTRPARKLLLIWNIISLGLLFNIVIIAMLSVHTPFQQFGFSQPNIAILHFPFNWLPAVVVPIVLFSHLAAIRQLTNTPRA